MKIKSHFYSIFFIIGILVLLISGILFVTTWIISEHIENQIGAKINQFESHLESNKNQAIENLINYCKYIATNQNLISAVELSDPEAIYSILEESNKFIDSGALIVTDSTGNLLTKSGYLNGINNIFEIPGISKLINNKDPVDHETINLWKIKTEYYLVSTVPIEKDGKTIGTLNISVLMSELFNQSIYENISFALLNKNEVLYSRFSYSNETITEFTYIHRPIVDAILTTSLPSDLFLTKIENNEVYSKLVPFGYKKPAYFLLSISKSHEFQFLDSLIKYLIYILIFSSLLFMVVFFEIGKRYSKQIEKLNLIIQQFDRKNKIEDSKDNAELKPSESITSEMSEELKGTILISKIICLDDTKHENDDSLINIFNSYQKIQTELIELYDGKVENIINNQMIAFFMGNEDTIEKSIQCSKAIIKLLNKESLTTNCQIAIVLNYGSIFYSSGGKSTLFGNTLKITESIIRIAKPGQILIQDNLSSKTELNFSKGEAKVWKFKNFKDEIRLVDLGLSKNNK